jgi:hypothetical protein
VAGRRAWPQARGERDQSESSVPGFVDGHRRAPRRTIASETKPRPQADRDVPPALVCVTVAVTEGVIVPHQPPGRSRQEIRGTDADEKRRCPFQRTEERLGPGFTAHLDWSASTTFPHQRQLDFPIQLP